MYNWLLVNELEDYDCGWVLKLFLTVVGEYVAKLTNLIS